MFVSAIVLLLISNSVFLFLLQQGDISQAEKCADQAVIADRYNAGGKILFFQNQYFRQIVINFIVHRIAYKICHLKSMSFI